MSLKLDLRRKTKGLEFLKTVPYHEVPFEILDENYEKLKRTQREYQECAIRFENEGNMKISDLYLKLRRQSKEIEQLFNKWRE